MEPIKKKSLPSNSLASVSKETTAKDLAALKEFGEMLKKDPNFSGVLSLQLGNLLVVNHAYCPHTPFKSDQIFNTNSVGKIFTAIAIMQLCEKGILKLDDPISTYLDQEDLDLPLQSPYDAYKPDQKNLQALQEHAHKITIRQLLNHTSGLTRIGNEQREQFVAQRNLKSLHPYSNYAYQLLAEIIGRYTESSQASPSNFHKAFQDHMQQEIFAKANMHVAPNNTHVPENPIEQEPYPHGNGNWKMRSQDLLAFNKALQTKGLLIEELNLMEMIENHLGFQVDRNNLGEIIGYGHSNMTPDNGTFFYTFLSRGHEPITVVALSDNHKTNQIKPKLEAHLKRAGYWL